MIHLYIKTHNKTGLKYFGKTTSNDPFEYKGSGIRWKAHIDKHGYDVTTEIIASYNEEDIEECREFSIKFSEDNNIVESKNWANLKIESLDGGWDYVNSLPKEVRVKWIMEWRDSLTECQREEIDSKKSNKGEDNFWYGKCRSGELNPRFGVKLSDDTKSKISESKKGRMLVKDAETEEFIGLVDVSHENILNGDWVSINKGKKHTEDSKKRKSKQYKELGIRPPSPKGKLWWNDGNINVRSAECPGDEFSRGRLKFKTKSDDEV